MSTSDTLPTKIVSVPHLGGTKISYHLTKPIVGSKPTLILINAFTTTATFFRPQLTDTALLDEMNLVAMEPLGHGNSSTVSPSWTFWDSAAAFLQAMDALGVRKAYVLGSSQGGWMAVRMALLAPTRVTGIISINSHMGAADAHMLELGCLDFTPGLTENIKAFAKADPEFKLPEDMIPSFAPLSLGPSPSDADMSLFVSSANKVYAGDSGRQKIRAAIIALLSAVIFPAASTVRVRAQESQVISNLKSLQASLNLYKQDEHGYPPTLGPVVYPGSDLHAYAAMYPEWVRDQAAFHSPNNQLDNPDSLYPIDLAASTKANIAPANPKDAAAFIQANPDYISGAQMYGWDTMDGSVDKDTGQYVLHYSRYRTWDPNDDDYKRQLGYRNPPENTVVTWNDTFVDWGDAGSHTDDRGDLLVLYLDGTVKKYDVHSSTNQNLFNSVNYQFWRLKP